MRTTGAALLLAAPLLLLGGLILSSTTTTPDTSAESLEGVPPQYLTDVMKAGALCPDVVTSGVIAAQIEAESAWNPRAVSPVGAQGLTQFMPGTWAMHGIDGDGDGKADPFNPHDAIASQGKYMCYLAEVVKGWGYTSNTIDITLAAYNAGLGNVQKYGGIPPFAETKNYIAKIKENAASKNTFTALGGSSTLVATAKRYLGVPYVWGGTTEDGLDCSGLIVRSYADMGKPLTVRTADDITRTYAHLKPVSRNQLRPGDLISLRHPGTTRYYHIGIYAGIENGTPMYLHAPTFGDVVSIVPLDAMLAGNDWTAFRI